METNPFDLTPEHKGLLVALARETGKPLSALIAEALEGLQEHMHPDRAHDTTHERHEARAGAAPPPAARKPIWEQFIEALQSGMPLAHTWLLSAPSMMGGRPHTVQDVREVPDETMERYHSGRSGDRGVMEWRRTGADQTGWL